MVNIKFIIILKGNDIIVKFYNYAIYIKAWKFLKLYSIRTVSFI